MPDTRLCFGYAFDGTGQPHEHFTPRVPDNDRHLFSIGVGHKFTRSWDLDIAYIYVVFKDRDFRGDKLFVPGKGINGTNAVDGNNRLTSHVFALELSASF